jgi:hypothetical protein
MVYLKSKKTNFGTFQQTLEQKFLVYFAAIWYFKVIWCILWPFINIFGYLIDFFTFWYVVPRKIWQP